MSKDDLRQQAAISVLNSLLETTEHSITEAVAIKDIYAHVAVLYADALVSALDKGKDDIVNWLTGESLKDLKGKIAKFI